MRYLAVEHEGNARESVEEAREVASQVDALLGAQYTTEDGTVRPLQGDDIMVVAPYNAQVRCLREHLPDDVRVGTVDKFRARRRLSPSSRWRHPVVLSWPDWEKVQPAVALSSWKHQTILLDRLDDPDLRLRYAAWSAESGWSANTLALQIANKRHLSIGVAQARRTGHVLRRDHRPRGARRAQVRRDDRGRLRSGSTTTDPLQEYFNPATEEWIEYLVTGEESDGELVRYRWRRRRVRRMRQCRNGSRG